MNIKKRIRKTFPITEWIPSYGKKDLSGDLKAGITTGIMFIPQGMAYAVIAGLPPIYGLYAGIIPLFIYPLFASSRHLSVGPVAVDMIIVAAGISAVSLSASSNIVGLVILLSLMTGLLQLLMGSLKLGSLLNFFSRPVITGFIMAAPIIISLTQLENMFGLPVNIDQNLIFILSDFIFDLQMVHLPTLYWTAASILLLLIIKKATPSLPGSMIVLGLGILISWFANTEQQGVAIVGGIEDGLPPLSLPDISYTSIVALLPTALTLALVQFMTVTSLGNVFAKRHGYLIDSNQELISIGSSNFLGSFFSSIPISASFSRSAASDQSGGKTPAANWVTAAIVVLTLLFLTPVFYYLPIPVLASIIVVSVFGLIDVEEVKFLIKTRKSEGGIAVFTFVSTLMIGIQDGILLGVGVSMLMMIYKISRPTVAELGVIPDTHSFKNLERNPDATRIEGILILRIDASFSFINAEFFRDFILNKSKKQAKETRYVIIDGSSINHLDTTAIDSLISVIKTLRKWDMDLYLSGLKGPVRDIIERSGFEEYLGSDHFYRTPHMAVKHVLELLDKKDDGSRADDYKKLSY
jgi:SulP family sulfate permease